MADPSSSTVPKSARTGTDKRATAIEPLTRRGYKRLPATQKQIEAASTLDMAALVTQARQRDQNAPDFLSSEALVYFIRRADKMDDRKCREALFRELLERCTPFFRGKFRGFNLEVQQDLQGDVLKGLVEDLLSPDDRGDFMQVRFWTYLERKTIDACRATFRNDDRMESLDTGYSGKGQSEGRTRLESHPDKKLTPEELMMLSEGLSALPPQLRHVYLLRHAVGMKIGGDDTADSEAGEMTLARHFSCTGRTIRNWLKEADNQLAGFREK